MEARIRALESLTKNELLLKLDHSRFETVEDIYEKSEKIKQILDENEYWKKRANNDFGFPVRYFEDSQLSGLERYKEIMKFQTQRSALKSQVFRALKLGNVGLLEYLVTIPIIKDEDYCEVFVAAAEMNYLEMMKFIERTAEQVLTDHCLSLAMTQAITGDNEKIIEWLLKREYVNFQMYLKIALKEEDLGAIKMIVRKISKSSRKHYRDIMTEAVKTQDMEIIEYLYNEGFPLTMDSLSEALYKGDSYIIRFLVENDAIKNEGDANHAAHDAAESGNIEMFDLIFEKYKPYISHGLPAAIRMKKYKMAKHIIKKYPSYLKREDIKEALEINTSPEITDLLMPY